MHHISDLVSFQGRTDEHNGPHGGNYVVRSSGFLLLEERLLFVLGRRGGERLAASCVAEGVRLVSYITQVPT